VTSRPTPALLVERLRRGGPLVPTDVTFNQPQLEAYGRAVGIDTPAVVPEPLLVAACIATFDQTFDRVPGTLHLGQDLTVYRRPHPGRPVHISGEITGGENARRGWRFSIRFSGVCDDQPCFDAVMHGQVLL
jgi:hypothetical protein